MNDDDDDDPFRHLVAGVDQPSLKKDDENDGNSSDAGADNIVLVEDASTDEEDEGKDDHENVATADEVKRYFPVQELFPISVSIAADNDDDRDDEGAVSTSSHFNPTNSTIDIAEPHADVQNLPTFDECNDIPTIEGRDHATAAGCDTIDLNAGGSATQQQEIVPDAPAAAPPVAPTEARPDGGDDIGGQEPKADEVLLPFLDDEAVVSNHHHQSCPPQISPLQQEQPPQQHEQVQENLLDIPLSSYDLSHPYHDLQPPVESLVESVADTNVGDTITTTTITTAESTNANENLEEDSWESHIPSVYNKNIESGSAHGSNEAGQTRRDLEVNYALNTERTNENNHTLDDEHNYLNGSKASRKKKGEKSHGRVKQTSIDDFDEEQAVAVLPGMVAYTQLNEQDDDDGRIHNKKSQLKIPNKRRRQRRCITVLCILVLILMGTIAGLLYYLIASPSAKFTIGNNSNGNVELGEGTEEGGNLSDNAVNGNDLQHNVGEGVHDGLLPSKAPTSDSSQDLNTPLVASSDGVAGNANINGTMVESNHYHFQHDTSSNNTANAGNPLSTSTITGESQNDISYNATASIGNSSSTESTTDGSSTLSNNATESPLLSNSSDLSHANIIGEDVLHFESTSSTGTELSLTTTHGQGLVSDLSKSYGIVFDIESLVASITITGMDLYLDTSFSSRYEVWVRDGTEFVEIAHGTINGTGVCHDVHLDNCDFAPIPSDEFDSTTITVGRRKSFWVTLRDDDLVSHNFVAHDQDNGQVLEDADAVYATNTEMKVYYGTSILTYPIHLADPETDYRSSRGFIGKIRYKVLGASGNLTEHSGIVEHTQMPVIQTSEIPSTQPSISPTNVTPQDLIVSCHYVTEESCREAASSLGLHLGGAGFPFAGPYSRAGCHFYPCSNCLYGGIAYFGTMGTALDFQSTHSVHSEKRLDCNTNQYSLEDESPFWCLFPTKKCAG